jgi:thymidine kinase
MANLIFYYGAMGCSKTANALMTRFQYIDKGLSVWLIKPEVDTRDNIINSDGLITAIVKSRVGISGEADVIKSNDKIVPPNNIDLIICDEAQFLNEFQVDELKAIAETLDIPVYCYGLRTDFKTKLFPGSKRLFEISSKVVELESVCSCGNQAIVNARFNSRGKIVTAGSQIEIGGDERYRALCYSCWKKLSESSIEVKTNE